MFYKKVDQRKISMLQSLFKKRLQHRCLIRVPEVPFRLFDKLKNEIQKYIPRFYFYLNIENEIQITDYHFRVKIDFYFEFLLLSFALHFNKTWKTKYSFFHFHFSFSWIEKRVIFTSMVFTLFKGKFVPSPQRFSAVQRSRGHQASAV